MVPTKDREVPEPEDRDESDHDHEGQEHRERDVLPASPQRRDRCEVRTQRGETDPMQIGHVRQIQAQRRRD